jgi:hypothetical protein
LVAIGVHSPEFPFKKTIDNVRWAVKDMHIAYPVAIDNDHAIWRGLNNEYWPALYFMDAKQRIRHISAIADTTCAAKRVQKLLIGLKRLATRGTSDRKLWGQEAHRLPLWLVSATGSDFEPRWRVDS